ncbi:MAG: helix-turn-helix domain-containing protein [Sphingomonas bacterium]
MRLQRLPASPALRSLVSAFEERTAHFGEANLTHPLPARPDLFIEIYLAEQYRASHDNQEFTISPEVSLVGPHGVGTTRLLMSGEVKAFSIRLQPGAIHRLIGLDMRHIANEGVAMADVFGQITTGLRDAVFSATDFPARVTAAERWFGGMWNDLRPVDRIDMAARLLLRSGGQTRIDALSDWAGLSERQFNRRFSRQVGLAPKHYARTARLSALLDARRRRPTARWTDLAYAAGYADQAHFVRECRDLTGASPLPFFADWTRIGAT